MDYYNNPPSGNNHYDSAPSNQNHNQRPSSHSVGAAPNAAPGRQPSSAPGSGNANSNSGAPSASSPQAPRIRRRNRMITSCLECRRRKLKCNKSHPCTNCVKFNRDCVFLAPALDQASQLKLTEIKEKVGSLERLLERDVAKSSHSAQSAHNQGPALPDDEDDNLPANEDEKDLEPTPLAVVDAAYEIDGEDDDLLDLGIQLGKMRITERIGGFFRPKISQELEFTMSDTYMTGHKDIDDKTALSPPPQPAPLPPANEWLKPGPSYIIPSSGFFFGTSSQGASLIDFLPSRLAADRLIKQYFECVHPICQIVHRPTFEKEYAVFWDEVSLGIEPAVSVQTIVFAAMFSGVVSMDESVIIRDFGVAKLSLIDNFKQGTETALARANFLRTTKIEVLQSFVMYLLPLCRAELSRAHSVLVGAAIRMAECMGLHRDGETYGMNPLETHIRRLVWHQLCFLDIRTCEAQGPRPTIRRDEFDTKLPLNVDDNDLHATGKPPSGANRWTDSTFCLIRFEINEMMRSIWIDRPRIERRKISLTAVLSKIETFRTNMAARYDHLMDDRVPVQKCAKIIKALLLSRLHIMILHRYHNSVVAPMPERLRNIMLASGTTTIETAVALETLPELRNWSWYSGALQQYHTAFLLLMEVYVYPQRKEADRIWHCLDYIFETNPSEPRRSKGKKILSELQRKTAVYQSMRGMRAPVVMNKHVGQREPRVSDKNSEMRHGSGAGVGGMQYLKAPKETEGSVETVKYNRPDGIIGVPGPSIGRVPILPDVTFAGGTSNDSLWALNNPGHPSQSPEGSNNSDKGSFSGPSGNPNNGGFGSGSGGVNGGGNGGNVNGGGMMMVGGGPAFGGQPQLGPTRPQDTDMIAEIDWDAFDALFPPDRPQPLFDQANSNWQFPHF